MRKTALLVGTALCIAASPAAAQSRSQPESQSRTRITPHIEASQVLTADLQSGDVLTYSTLGGGVDVSVQSRRVQVQLSYNYEHRFGYDERIADSDVHSGLARASANIMRGVSIDGSAIATRTRSDIRGAAPTLLAGNPDNISQVFSADAGPTVSTSIGPVGIGAGYRFGYTKVTTPASPRCRRASRGSIIMTARPATPSMRAQASRRDASCPSASRSAAR